ncbi:NAD(P)H-dependent flavin oxidoreductase [Arthrobacter sp. NIO-1057]|uniref:NAD(P)H-dependent flavin oxidoreductase n=1 Tax=Arthrobacter sp. NIO-1057 TaxID=993071 RepID=UPI00071CDCD6|nr:nitronate monooxygenase [Arthrobacter sp. NIO-1057]KSU65178.1 2-nitropropane dioxygenase [Arthrobacter sp. NIO-1057]SCC48543.1 nitronate monooxygenase [Arthrobacter sp. NIO-1057]
MSDLQHLLGYREPIFNAPMAGAAGGALAAAVSQAGGVGMIGVSGSPKTEWIKEQVGHVADLETSWGVGFMAWSLEADLSPLESFLEFSPSLVSLSFGDVTRSAALAHEAGVLTAMQIGNAAELERAMEDDIDIIIARGGEGGGHGRNESATLPLLQLATAQHTKPVVAAGGIGTAHGVAAALTAGAQAAWVGTRFLSASESLGHENFKSAVRQAGMDDTTYTRAFDIAQQLAWPAEFGGRALRNEFSETHDDLTSWEATPELRDEMLQARAEARANMAPVYAGQAVQFVQAPQTAAEVVTELAGFRQILRDTASRFA